MPILPFINDSWEEIERLIIASHKAGAKYLLFAPGLTLRSGSREYFYKKLDIHFPGIKEKYVQKYGNDYSCNSHNAKMLYSKAKNLCEKLDLPMKMKFYEEKKPNQLNLF